MTAVPLINRPSKAEYFSMIGSSWDHLTQRQPGEGWVWLRTPTPAEYKGGSTSRSYAKSKLLLSSL